MRRPNARRTMSVSSFFTLVMLFAGLALAACRAATNASDRGATGGPPTAGSPAVMEPTADPVATTERRGIFVQHVTLRDAPYSNQTELVIDLSLPDACTELHHVDMREGKRIRIELWGIGRTDPTCEQVPREETLVISLGAMVDESWIIEVNGMRIDWKSVAREEPGSGSHEYGYAMIEQVEVRRGDEQPRRVVLAIQGALPDACSELIEPPEVTFVDAKVIVTLEWQRPRGLICAQVLRPFATTVDLGELEPGTYTLSVNDLEMTFTVEAS